MNRAERRRKDRDYQRNRMQLYSLALSREESGYGELDEILELFKKHLLTDEACPDGHPEVAFALLDKPLMDYYQE